jgi:hypothetical protein
LRRCIASVWIFEVGMLLGCVMGASNRESSAMRLNVTTSLAVYGASWAQNLERKAQVRDGRVKPICHAE